MSETDKIPLKIKPFDPSTMRPHCTMVMLGKRGAGKTTVVKDLLYHNRDLPAGCVISGSEEANGFYNEIMPSILIKHEFKSEHIKNLVQRQKNIIDKNKAGDKADPRAFLILDDCLYDGGWAKDKEVRRVFLNGRHYKITFLATMQYPLGIPPILRTNVDYVFILRDNIRANQERIYKSYAGVFPSFNVFQQVMEKLTTNYGCLVIDNTTMSTNLTDSIFWYKAKLRGHFKLCCESLWRLDESYRLQKEKEGREEEDAQSELMCMRKAPRVYVQKLMEGRG